MGGAGSCCWDSSPKPNPTLAWPVAFTHFHFYFANLKPDSEETGAERYLMADCRAIQCCEPKCKQQIPPERNRPRLSQTPDRDWRLARTAGGGTPALCQLDANRAAKPVWFHLLEGMASDGSPTSFSLAPGPGGDQDTKSGDFRTMSIITWASSAPWVKGVRG